MPSYQQDYDEIKALQQKASTASKEAGTYTSGATTFEDQVMQGVQAHRAERGASSLTEDIANVSGRLATYGPGIEERTSGIVDPLRVDALRAEERGNLLSQLTRLSRMSEKQEGTIEDVIGAGANKLLAAAEKKKAEAAQAESEANMLLKLIQTKQEEAQREAQRQMAEKEYDLAEQKFEYDKTTGGGGGDEEVGKNEITAWANQLLNFKPGTVEYESIMNLMPSDLRGKVLARLKTIKAEKKRVNELNKKLETKKKEKESRTINVKGKSITLPKNIDLSPLLKSYQNQNRNETGIYY